MPKATVHRLSKSKYVSGLQCPKLLWWQVHEPRSPELVPDPEQQYLFDRGHEVGRVAQSYVPGGVLIDVPHYARKHRLNKTAKAIREGAKVLYEAAFEHDGVIIVADILERIRGGWSVIEVKSSTRVKPQHIPDLAIQVHVLRGAGLKVRRAELMHLNRECQHPDLSNLFEREVVTEDVEDLVPTVPKELRRLIRALKGSLPDVPIGDHCHDPYDCPFINRCWPEQLPNAIETLYRIRRNRIESYEAAGYRTILDLPDEENLTAIQDRQRRAAQRNRLVVEDGLASALDEFDPPFAYLDFETIAPPIPVWKGCRPYDQIPVQLSVHRKPVRGRMIHHEWLTEGSGDPRKMVAKKLLEFTEGAETILAYHAPFERSCIQGLKKNLPSLARKLDAVENKIQDLLPVVRDHVYHPRFNGSFGLKSVAPTLVPEIDYEQLDVSGGGRASQMLYDLLLRSDTMKAAETKRTRKGLLRYCKTDTKALVELHKKLTRFASGK